MAVQLFKQPWHKRVATGLIVLLVLILIPVLFIDTYLTPKLSEKLKEGIIKGTDSLYHISFSKVELHALKGEAVLYDITLQPDTAVYHKIQRSRSATDKLYQVKIKRLVITDAHPFQLLFKKELNIGLIDLVEPQIQLGKYSTNSTDTSSKDNRTIYQKLSSSLKLIHVREIRLNNVNFTYKDNTGIKPAVSELKKMNLKAIDLLIDSATQTDTSRTLFCKDIITRLYNFSGKSVKDLYSYNIRSAMFSTRSARLMLTGIDLRPLPSKAFFIKTQTDRFNIHLNRAELNNFDFDTYRKKQEVDISSATLTNGWLEVFSNPNAPLSSGNKIVTFPHWLLRNIKTRLNVDTLNIRRIAVTYKEYNKKTSKTGAIWFTNTNGRLLNITNKKALLLKSNICTANLTTSFMSKGQLKVLFTFNLNDANYNYSYKGHLGAMEMKVINAAVMPLGLLKINSGTVNGLDFNIHSTQKTSAGWVKLLYNNLNITMLGDGKKTYNQKPLLSLLANSLILKKNNPDEAGAAPRTANVVYIRPTNFPYFQTVWLTLLKGIKSCAGIGDKAKENKPQKLLTKKELKQQKKALKKAEKLKKKEEKAFKKKLEEQREKAKNN
jgi:hypothetical protein